MATAKAYFLLPLRDNEGRDLRAEIDELLHAVFDRFDGWTREGTTDGAFRMADGSMALDSCEKYLAFLEETRLHELEELLREFKGKARQEKIFMEVQHHVDIRLI